MSADLLWLTLTALLAASLWIPFVVGVNITPTQAGTDPFARPHDLATLPAWVHRAHRAHLNLIEQFVPFAVLVLVAHLTGQSGALTAWVAALFFALRVIHAVIMITGRGANPLRPVVFLSAWACVLILGGAILI